jgi:chaperonin cofactor prefoldin
MFVNSDDLLIKKYTYWLKEIEQKEDKLVVILKDLTKQKKEIATWIKELKEESN